MLLISHYAISSFAEIQTSTFTSIHLNRQRTTVVVWDSEFANLLPPIYHIMLVCYFSSSDDLISKSFHCFLSQIRDF